VVAWIPCVGFCAIPFAIVGLLLSLVGFIISFAEESGVAVPAVGMVVGVAALVLPFVTTWGVGKMAENSATSQPASVPASNPANP